RLARAARGALRGERGHPARAARSRAPRPRARLPRLLRPRDPRYLRAGGAIALVADVFARPLGDEARGATAGAPRGSSGRRDPGSARASATRRKRLASGVFAKGVVF